MVDERYITITDPGKTVFHVGDIVSREVFEKENQRVIKRGEKPAVGRVHDEHYIDPGPFILAVMVFTMVSLLINLALRPPRSI